MEDPELLQPATPSPVRSSSQGARLEGAGEVEWVDEAPEDGPPTRSLEGSAAGKAVSLSQQVLTRDAFYATFLAPFGCAFRPPLF